MAEDAKPAAPIAAERSGPCICPPPERGGLPEKLYWASRNGCTEDVKSWLAEEGNDVNAADHEGDTMLRGACRGGQTAVLMELLTYEHLHLNMRDGDGRTPLMKAARRGQDATVRMLCAANMKCELDYAAIDKEGNTALSLAVVNDHWKVVLALLQERHAYPRTSLDLTCNMALKKRKSKVLEQLTHLGYLEGMKQRPEYRSHKIKVSVDALNLGTLRIPSSSDEEESMAWVTPSPPVQYVESQPISTVDNVYQRITNHCRGRVCILNYKQFWSRPDLLRKGSEKDFMKLESLFTDLQYAVQGHWNLNRDQTLATLKEFSQQEQFENADCAVIVITSHGEQGPIFKTSDMQDIPVPTILNLFVDSKCPHLKGKPKIFLFNFCRGTERHEWSSLTTDNIAEPPRDIMCVYSTTESFVSYRDLSKGSPFISSMCEVIAKHYCKVDLEEILRKFHESYMKSVTPEIQNFRFQKKFYF